MRKSAKTSKYLQLAEQLRLEIKSGRLRPGDRLPSEAEARQRFGVSFSTVDWAFSLLEQEGLIVRQHGRGTFVAEPVVRYERRTLGLVWRPGVTDKFYAPVVLAGIREEAARRGLILVLINDNETVNSQRVDAVILYCNPLEGLTLQIPQRMPQVMLFHRSPEFFSICFDDFGGARMAARHLIGLGHRRIACLPHSDYDSVSRQRLAGVMNAVEDAGLGWAQQQVRYLDGVDSGYLQAGQKTMTQWLEDDWAETRCTAIFAHNDLAAMGVLLALQAYGRGVPGELSVMGFDGTELSDLSVPPLTTVNVPLADLGVRAVCEICDQMDGKTPVDNREVILPVQLKLGQSTAVCAASRRDALTSGRK